MHGLRERLKREGGNRQGRSLGRPRASQRRFSSQGPFCFVGQCMCHLSAEKQVGKTQLGGKCVQRMRELCVSQSTFG